MSNNTPALRFKGFTGAWTQRKLEDVAEFSRGTGYSKSDLTSKGTPIILYGRLYTKYETEINDVDTFVDIRENSVLSQGGEVIVPSSGETAEDISRASVVTRAGVVLGGDLNIVKPNATIYPPFLAVTISNGNQQKELSRRAQGKSVVHISNSDLKDVILQLPCLEEQAAIGTFFRTLDDIIAASQRKVAGLKRLKAAYLQQMFPQAGARVPGVRFSGFSEDWNEVMLGEMLVERNDQTEESAEYPLMSFVGNVGVVPKGEQYDRSFLVKDESKKYKKTMLNDFIYSSNNLETGSIGFNRTGNAVISPVYSIFHSNNDSESQFIGLLSNRRDFINKMIHYRQGVMYGQWRIHEKDFLKIIILSPSTAEQNKIIHFFHILDEQISVGQDKLENLKQLKSSYLQKMFV